MKKQFTIEAIALLLRSILTEAKSRAYNNNVSVDDLEDIIKPLEESFISLK